jgi:glycosyl transferase family 25
MKLEFNNSNTFCISLQSNPSRWERMQSRCQSFELDVTKCIGSIGVNLVDNFEINLSREQKGCSTSHLRIYKYMIEYQLPYAFILEDDACFDKQWREKLKEIEPILDQDPEWDLIMLNASEPIIPINQWTLQTEQYLTAGYIISLKGATHILNWFRNCYYSSDWMTTRLQLAGHSYSYFPWLIIQEGKDSSIQPNSTEDFKKVQRCLREIDYSLDNYV